MKKILIVFAALILLWLSYLIWLWLSEKEPELSSEPMTQNTSSPRPTRPPLGERFSEMSRIPVDPRIPGNPGRTRFAQHPPLPVLPDLEVVRAEVAKDHVSTPPSLVRFSQELAPVMLAAKDPKNKPYAREVVLMLSNCAKSADIKTLRLYCTSNAEEIIRIHPPLKLFMTNQKPVQTRRKIDAEN